MHIGIIGSGQLARMLAEAGRKLNHHFTFVAESIEAAAPVIGFGELVLSKEGESAQHLYLRMGKPDVLTLESENVDVQLLRSFEHFCKVLPTPDAIEICQHRKNEKLFLKQLELPTVNFRFGQSLAELEKAVAEFSYPVIIKSCLSGYDGKNQWRIKNLQDWQKFAESYKKQTELVVEQCVPFSHELSLVAVRCESGETRFYPLSENRHKNGILLSSKVVTEDPLLQYEAVAQQYLQKIVEHLEYVGVIAMECFVVGGQLLINELAPRVHNSGHWTQQGCPSSQFDNHIRAICKMPLGDTASLGPTAMLNLLGRGINLQDMRLPGATMYWYNKECKPGRKVGHINLQDVSQLNLQQRLQSLEKLFYAD
ncbi:5-(carboxyamino)imidazole ribonucleotide synthase [Alteromonadaceae bacterium Bs31]|nr:5-(carboxyamino)imidazole ribonucleotide synthase [Alteromonadaceae bacterium Bs31]